MSTTRDDTALSQSTPPQLTTAELDAIYDRIRHRLPDPADRGALVYLSAECRSHAASLVKSGWSVSMAQDLPVVPTSEQPTPVVHRMLATGESRCTEGLPGYESTTDAVGINVHGLGTTHLDALCHMFVRGEMYGGLGPELVDEQGAQRNSVMTAASGISGRGVLLDVPGALEVDFLAPTHTITVAELEAAEKAQSVEVAEGDLLVISTGRDARRRANDGQLNPFVEGLAGLHPECLQWLHDKKIALLGSDGISDLMPARDNPQWPFPIHQMAIVGLGLHLVDNMQLVDILASCRAVRRWEFLLVVAPLRVPGGTGSPVNPIAIL